MMMMMMMMMMNSRYYQAIYRCLNDFMQNQPNCVSEVRDAILEAARLYTLPFTSKYDCSVAAASPGSSTVAIRWFTRRRSRIQFNNGAGTNLKVGGGEAHVWREAPEIFWSCPSTFLALKVQLVVLVSAFVMVSTVWSVSFLLFLYSRCCPPCRAICKSGGGSCPPCAL